MCLSNSLISNMPRHNINPFGNALLSSVHAHTLLGNLQAIWSSHIRKRQCRCAGYGTRHIRYRIMNDSMLLVSRLVMGCDAVNRLNGAPLINRNVHNDTAGTHCFDHLFGHQTRCRAPESILRLQPNQLVARLQQCYNGLDIIVFTRPWKRSSNWRKRSGFKSTIVTSAPKPIAIFAAFAPTIPPPITATFPGSTPGTPPSRIPLPPCAFSKNAPRFGQTCGLPLHSLASIMADCRCPTESSHRQWQLLSCVLEHVSVQPQVQGEDTYTKSNLRGSNHTPRERFFHFDNHFS